MKLQPRFALSDIAAHYGLQIEYAADLPPAVHGCLPPGKDPRFILVNAAQPTFEQRFTIAHEIGHYLLHHNRPRREHSNWFLSRRWKARHLAVAHRYIRHCIFRTFTEEFEADLWAISLLIHIGDRPTLQSYLEHHPEKTAWYVFLLLVSLVRALPRILLGGAKRLLRPLYAL